jgi:hypothetical protein
MSHFRTVCSCGVVIAQCRCPGNPKSETVVERGCAVCKEPTAVFPKCPDCGRSKSTHLELLEVQRRNGYARTDCFTCRLTDIERKPFAPAV